MLKGEGRQVAGDACLYAEPSLDLGQLVHKVSQLGLDRHIACMHAQGAELRGTRDLTVLAQCIVSQLRGGGIDPRTPVCLPSMARALR